MVFVARIFPVVRANVPKERGGAEQTKEEVWLRIIFSERMRDRCADEKGPIIVLNHRLWMNLALLWRHWHKCLSDT